VHNQHHKTNQTTNPTLTHHYRTPEQHATVNLIFHLTRHVTSRHDSTGRHVRRVEPMHFGCVEHVEQDGSTRSSRRARLVLHDKLDWLDTSNVSRRAKWTLGLGVQLNVVVTRLLS